jgi:hypothetical protein
MSSSNDNNSKREEICKRISDLISSILFLVFIIYLSKLMFFSPMSIFYIMILMYSIGIGYYLTFGIMNAIDEEKHSVIEGELINIIKEEPSTSKLVEKEETTTDKKYKTLLKKFKDIKKDFLKTKNDIKNIKDLLSKKEEEEENDDEENDDEENDDEKNDDEENCSVISKQGISEDFQINDLDEIIEKSILDLNDDNFELINKMD